MADALETLRDVLAETLGVPVRIPDAEAVAAQLHRYEAKRDEELRRLDAESPVFYAD